jgi:hypothetical protein
MVNAKEQYPIWRNVEIRPIAGENRGCVGLNGWAQVGAQRGGDDEAGSGSSLRAHSPHGHATTSRSVPPGKKLQFR